MKFFSKWLNKQKGAEIAQEEEARTIILGETEKIQTTLRALAENRCFYTGTNHISS